MAIGLVLLLLLLFLVLLFSFLSLLLYPFVTHFSFGLLHALGPGCCLSVRRCLIVLCIGISPHAVCLSAVLVQSVSMSFPQFSNRAPNYLLGARWHFKLFTVSVIIVCIS